MVTPAGNGSAYCPAAVYEHVAMGPVMTQLSGAVAVAIRRLGRGDEHDAAGRGSEGKGEGATEAYQPCATGTAEVRRANDRLGGLAWQSGSRRKHGVPSEVADRRSHPRRLTSASTGSGDSANPAITNRALLSILPRARDRGDNGQAVVVYAVLVGRFDRSRNF